eukprot:TRINITY_DN57995_c0_g1_i1.p1 TRINITY_DN57995_c0_g1~~TRINITY_DN57995_c0_g1_i1.p1  ORF type:complete len:532 (+),score=92.20 TRINITY_DN57995_c0_g1_i1:165-1760(+)
MVLTPRPLASPRPAPSPRGSAAGGADRGWAVASAAATLKRRLGRARQRRNSMAAVFEDEQLPNHYYRVGVAQRASAPRTSMPREAAVEGLAATAAAAAAAAFAAVQSASVWAAGCDETPAAAPCPTPRRHSAPACNGSRGGRFSREHNDDWPLLRTAAWDWPLSRQESLLRILQLDALIMTATADEQSQSNAFHSDEPNCFRSKCESANPPAESCQAKPVNKSLGEPRDCQIIGSKVNATPARIPLLRIPPPPEVRTCGEACVVEAKELVDVSCRDTDFPCFSRGRDCCRFETGETHRAEMLVVEAAFLASRRLLANVQFMRLQLEAYVNEVSVDAGQRFGSRTTKFDDLEHDLWCEQRMCECLAALGRVREVTASTHKYNIEAVAQTSSLVFPCIGEDPVETDGDVRNQIFSEFGDICFDDLAFRDDHKIYAAAAEAALRAAQRALADVASQAPLSPKWTLTKPSHPAACVGADVAETSDIAWYLDDCGSGVEHISGEDLHDGGLADAWRDNCSEVSTERPRKNFPRKAG